MSDQHTPDRDDGTPQAAEYVLGVLSASERRDFEGRLAQEPALRTEVEFWEQRLGSLASDVKSVDPSPETWARIEAALGTGSHSATRAGLWHSLTFWRLAAIGSAAVAAASLVALVGVGRFSPVDQPLVAKLDVPSGQAGFVAAIDATRNGLTIVPASVTNLNQRVMELWVIAPGDKPRSLGLIEPGRAIHINLPAELTQRMAADATLAVSLEPPGGSPTGAPTGPVIASGKLTKL
jgi:anti-sigma-K factor RskA